MSPFVLPFLAGFAGESYMPTLSLMMTTRPMRSKPSNQRKDRLARRRKHAAGFRDAFA
jgi:hypothetical protein